MHIKVTVEVYANPSDYGPMAKVVAEESVMDDRKPEFGEPGYGRPTFKQPWERGPKVLEYLGAVTQTRTREKLSELHVEEARELEKKQIAWDQEHPDVEHGLPTADVPF